MNEILNNPLMKAFLNTTFKKYLEKEKLNGIYVNFDANGQICLTEYKTAPNKNEANE